MYVQKKKKELKFIISDCRDGKSFYIVNMYKVQNHYNR